MLSAWMCGYSCSMITFWVIILLKGILLPSFLHCKSWLRLDLLEGPSHASRWFLIVHLARKYLPIVFNIFWLPFLWLKYAYSIIFVTDRNWLGFMCLSVNGIHFWRDFCLGKLQRLEREGNGSRIFFLAIIHWYETRCCLRA